MCDALYREIADSSKRFAVLSSEAGLATIGRAPESSRHQIRFFDRLNERFEVKVVYYVRNQLEQIESAFYTNARIHNAPLDEAGLDAYIAVAIEQFDFWQNIESYWVGLVGQDNILTKTYHRDNLKNADSVQDFLALTSLYDEQWKRFRPSQTTQHDTPEYRDPAKRGRLLTKAHRALLIERFLEPNRRYAEKYLDEDSARYLLMGFDQAD